MKPDETLNSFSGEAPRFSRVSISLRIRGESFQVVPVSEALGLHPRYVRAPDRRLISELTEETVAGYCSYESLDSTDVGQALLDAALHVREHRPTLLRLCEQGCDLDLFVHLYFTGTASVTLDRTVVAALAESRVACGLDLYKEGTQDEEDEEADVPEQVSSQGPPGTMWFGGGVDRLALLLRVETSSLSVEEVSKLLDCEPNVLGHGCWAYGIPESRDADFDEQVSELFSKVSARTEDWDALGTYASIDLVCCVELKRFNRGLEMWWEALSELARRHASVRLWASGAL